MKTVSFSPDEVRIEYNLPMTEDIERIINMYMIASTIGVGPKVVDIFSDKRRIVIILEKVIPIRQPIGEDDYTDVLPPGLTGDVARILIAKTVRTLQQHGYAHGDLNTYNVALRQNSSGNYDGVLLDLDTAYHIATGEINLEFNK